MYFKKIEMHGFKSFAEPVVIEFNKGITCVVGPNGSGKSNISDAIRWVLGEQSPRMLRGGKMEEVIFSGTASRKSRGMAEVVLTIDNEDGSLPIDYKEVAITRRMFRSGESEYLINGNQCRLRDIRSLIMDTGIGVDGYSIIGQGKISDIISNKTESRREIFEEAAGIVAYRTKKAESERKLTAAAANMDRVEDIIGEIEGRIDGLREDSIKAKEYLELKDRYKELEINITLKNIEDLQLKNEYIKDDIMEMQVKIDEDTESKLEKEKDLTFYTERSAELEKESSEAGDKLIAAIEELNRSISRSHVDKERISSIDGNVEKLQNETAALSEKITCDRETLDSYTLKKNELDKELACAVSMLDEKTAAYEEKNRELTSLQEEIDEYKNDVFEIYSSLNSGKAEIASLERLQETLEKRKTLLNEEQNSREGSNKETLDSLNRIRREKDALAADIDNSKESVNERQERLEICREQESSALRSAEELNLSISKLAARVKTIEEMEHNYEGYNYAVKYIMKAELRGIHGVVADLIKVPDGYETAIETALGASLQNIVCDDDDSARRAIEALKRSRAGRLTFLPVSSVRGRGSVNTRVASMKGFIGFGNDSVKYDERYRSIMEYLLGRVVLVDNMVNAVSMSKEASGFRFVTLDGEVINAGGAITGGKYRNRTANILDRKAEIGRLRADVAAKREEYQKAHGRALELKDEASTLSSEIAALEDEVRKQEYDLLSKENELKLEEAALREIKSGKSKLIAEMDSIQREKENSLEMINQTKKKMEEEKAAIAGLEMKTEQRSELYEIKKVGLSEAGEQITAARISVNSLEKESSHMRDIMSITEESLRSSEKDMESKSGEMRRLKAEREDILSREGTSEDSIRAQEEKKRSLEQYIKDIGEERSGISAKITGLNSEKEELDSRLSNARNQKYQLEIKNAKNETQLDTYKNRLWEDFEVSYVQAMEFRSDDFVMSSAVKENRKIKSRMKELGDVNTGAIEEYETVKERYDFLTGQRDDIQEAMDSLNKIIGDMDRTIKSRFRESFDRIVGNFEDEFRDLFGGGHAELRLSDENDPLGSDIDIVAQPPGKKLQNINLMSGGEKTLTAIALMFAVLKAKPTPFCILDEVEAALDDANIDRFIECLRKFNDIQFTLVTHQKATMEHADVLYGVTMPEKGVSKILSLSLAEDFQYDEEGKIANV